MKIKNKKDCFKILYYIILLFFINRFFQFELFQKCPFFHKIYINFSRISFLIILILWLKNKKNFKDIKLLLLISIYFVLVLMLTILNSGNVRSFIMMSYPIIGTILLICLGIHKNIDLLLESFVYLFYGLIVINFFDAILFKDISSEYSTNYYFIGGKNQLAISFSVGFCFVKIYYEKYRTLKSKFILISYMWFVIMTAIISKSGTCIISVMILIILNYFSFVKKILKPFRFLFGYLIFLYGIIVLKVQNYFKFFIVDILHKDITFTHRTIIWEKALAEIRKSLFLGHGIHKNANYFQIEVVYPNGKFLQEFSAHNQIIQHLYENGVIVILILALLYFFCCRNRIKNKNFIYFFNTIIVILITWLSEAPGIYAMFIMLTFCYHSDYIK